MGVKTASEQEFTCGLMLGAPPDRSSQTARRPAHAVAARRRGRRNAEVDQRPDRNNISRCSFTYSNQKGLLRTELL